jgi:hypothetical protein
MKRTEILERIQASNIIDILEVGNKQTYDISPTTAELNDADIPSWKNVQDAISVIGNINIPFTDNLSINWQTSIPPGQTQTYVELFGNNLPKYSIYSTDAITGYDSNTPQLHFDIKDNNGLLQAMTCNMPGNWILVF